MIGVFAQTLTTLCHCDIMLLAIALPLTRQCTRMLQKLLKMLRVDNNLNKSGLPYVCIALFGCLGGSEPFSRVLLSGGLLPGKRNEMRGPTDRRSVGFFFLTLSASAGVLGE